LIAVPVDFKCSPLQVGSAYLPLFGKLLIDFLPVKKSVGIQPAHVPLILWLKRVTANTHDVEIASADFDREITKSLPGRDEGGALLAFHRCSLCQESAPLVDCSAA
jgi:hypothetical protein